MLDVAYIFRSYHNGVITFFEFRDAVVAQLGAAPWYTHALQGFYEALQRSQNIGEFGEAWAEFRRWADLEQVRVRMF